MSYFKEETAYHPPNTVGGYSQPRSYWRRDWNRQHRPYIHTLGFSYQKTECLVWNDSLPVYNSWGEWMGGGDHPALRAFTDPDMVDASNRMYSKMTESLGDQSQWANNVLEANKSITGIVQRAGQLGRFVNQLRQGNFSGAAKTLSVPKPDKKMQRKLDKAKNVGDQFLEYHFGWVPLLQDIGNATKTLTKPDFGSRILRASASGAADGFNRQDRGRGHFFSETTTDVWKVRGTLRTRVTNPNAFLANQLGFANPLSVLWEAVPYSFVVDWFSNVGQCLSSMTDFVGVTTEDACTVTAVTQTYTSVLSEAVFDRSIGKDVPYYQSASFKKFKVGRGAYFNGPQLAIKPFKGFSATRGATAISLLLQKL